MTALMRRPMLVGGVSLSLGLWLLGSFQHSLAQMGEFSLLSAIALSSLFWWLNAKRTPPLDLSPVLTPVDRETAEKAIAQVETAISYLEAENQDIAPWKAKLAQLKPELDRNVLNLVVMGGKGTGKSSLVQALGNQWNVQEAPALFVPETDSDAIAYDLASKADLVLFLTNGDLTESELQSLSQLTRQHHRLLLVFNKQDQYLPEEQPVVLQQLQQRVSHLLASEEVMAIAASPSEIRVRKHQPDGSVQEWLEKPESAIAPLSAKISQILTTETSSLVWATTKRKADRLKGEIKDALNQVRRDRAMPIIEQYQWIAAATAFANPVPALDLLATGAITGQLVMDLGAIYQQKLDWEQAQTAAKTTGELMLKLGLVELSTNTISHFLKTHAVTYVAGGAAQGISAAYLTRVAGLSLIEYFQSQDIHAETGFNLEKLSNTLKTVFQQNQRAAFIQSFVKQGLAKLFPSNAQPQLSESSVTVA
ncbi:MAG: DUF697 domain-containing protein [Desertifilum sp. SIO1I2]|nr:DUF697 domain-containing protein [Desertifilum sp. SIO1I2]